MAYIKYFHNEILEVEDYFYINGKTKSDIPVHYIFAQEIYEGISLEPYYYHVKVVNSNKTIEYGDISILSINEMRQYKLKKIMDERI